MSKYLYKGRPKIIDRIPYPKLANQKHIIDTANFVIISSYPMSGIKKLGCPLSNEYYEDNVLELHLDIIYSICKNPFILIVGGFDVKRILKHKRRNEFQLIENHLYEFSNTSEDLRIALNVIPKNKTVVVDGSFLPTIESYSLLFNNVGQSKVLYSIRKSECVGVNTGSENIINYFSFLCERKTKGAYFINLIDFDRLRKKCLGVSFNKAKYDYEILEELKMTAIEDPSKSLRLDENYEFDN